MQKRGLNVSTKSYQNMLKKIQTKIKKGLKHNNTIIIGDNSSGKSELLKLIIANNQKNCYFIDSVNRTFDANKISEYRVLNYNFLNVLETRISEEYFNVQDSFDFEKTGIGAIEMLYFQFEHELSTLFKKFSGLDFKFKFVTEEIVIEKKVLIGKNITKISTGFQAILRLFLEILFYNKSLSNRLKVKNIIDSLIFVDDLEQKSSSISIIENPIIVIDEITEFLSAKNESNILGFLMDNFPEMKFIITTHSTDVIANAKDCNIIAIVGEKFQYMDGDDYQTITDVTELFAKLYKFDTTINKNKKDNDILLKNLFNLKISGNWTEDEEKQISNIDKNTLSNTQLLLIKQISSW